MFGHPHNFLCFIVTSIHLKCYTTSDVHHIICALYEKKLKKLMNQKKKDVIFMSRVLHVTYVWGTQCLGGSFLGGKLHAHDLVLKVWRDKQGVSKFLETLLPVYLLWKSWVPIVSLQKDLVTMPTISFHDLIIFAYSLVKFLNEKKLFTNK